MSSYVIVSVHSLFKNHHFIHTLFIIPLNLHIYKLLEFIIYLSFKYHILWNNPVEPPKWPINQFLSILQSRPRVSKAFCTNIYILCLELKVGFFVLKYFCTHLQQLAQTRQTPGQRQMMPNL